MTFLTALLISMFITITLIPVLKGFAVKMDLLDMPAQRKVHTKPMPKIGGLAMAVGIFVPAMFWLNQTPFIRAVLLGAGILVIFGIADDLKELGYKVKLVGQIAAAVIVVFKGDLAIQSVGSLLPVGIQLPQSVVILLTVVVIVGVTNAINLSDGLDGLAGGISMLSFVCIVYLAYAINDFAIALIAISVIGVIFGFLRFNTYPANIFMGDTGSQLLGFLAITLSLKITQGTVPYSPLLPLIVLGFPILDTLTVMTERVVSGRPPFVADKNHFHHKLMRLGLFHTEAVFVIYVLQALLVIAAFFLRFQAEWTILTIYCIFSGTIVFAFVFADRLGWQLKRYDLFDRVIKGKLKVLKEKHIIIKVSFRVFKYGLPTLLVFTVFIPDRMPVYFPLFSLGLAMLVIWSRLFKKEWMGTTIRVGIYMMVPFLLYLAQYYPREIIGSRTQIVYGLGFFGITLFMMLTLKFTRRRQGFKSSPMDFLVLFIALVVPNLPGIQLQSHPLGMLAVRAIVFLFGYEVLLGELRQEFDGIGLLTIIALLFLTARGLHSVL